MLQGSSLINIVLGMAACLLALSILIQILQEFYKFLFKSKSAAYKKVLLDLIGSQAGFLWQAPETADYRVRGPWDLFRRKPGGVLLPLGKEQLGEALTRAAPGWVTRLLDQIKQERAGEPSGADSTTWRAFLQRLGETEKGTTGFWTAQEIMGLLAEFGHKWPEGEFNIDKVTLPKTLDFAKLEAAARQRFLPHVEKVTRDFDLLERNMEYTNGRRNLRQTFMLGALVAFVMSYPIQDIWKKAAALTEEETVAMTEQVLNICQSREALEAAAEGGDDQAAEAVRKNLEQVNTLIGILSERLVAATSSDSAGTPADSAARAQGAPEADSTAPALGTRDADSQTIKVPIFTADFWGKGAKGWLCYILGCLATAVLLSFGAPFWNDIAKSVLNIKNSVARPPARAAAGTEEGAS